MASQTTYRYEALSAAGVTLNGTIDASTDADGRERLRQLGLSLRQFEPVVPMRTSPLNAADLSAFNDQLAQLARAGLPVEQGLKLLASDMSRGRLKTAVTAISHDLEAGRTLPEAIDAHRRAFPPLYASIVDAGIRVNNLPAVLFNLSRHLDLTRRMRASVSRAIAYPTMVLLAIVIVSAFLSGYALPTLIAAVTDRHGELQSFQMFYRYRQQPAPSPTLPMVTQIAIIFGQVAPFIAGAMIALVVATMMLWPVARGTSMGRWVSDSVLTRLPLFGAPLRLSLIGRWCDALQIGVSAGLDLPTSFSLASRSIGSARLSTDANRLADAASVGGRLDDVRPLSIMPAAVPAAIGISLESNSLAETLNALSTLYLKQAESRARMIPLVLTPMLVVVLAIILGVLLTAMFSPMIRMLNIIGGI